MPRSVNAVASRRRRKRIMNLAKGYWGSRSKVYTVAKNTVEKGLQYAYRDRKAKKREFRALWIQRINAGVREHGMTYARFMNGMKRAGITLDRKQLAELAATEPAAFKVLVEKAQGALK